jgi:hypothetical protein
MPDVPGDVMGSVCVPSLEILDFGQAPNRWTRKRPQPIICAVPLAVPLFRQAFGQGSYVAYRGYC